MSALLRGLDELIRETESFVAFHSIVDDAVARLTELRRVRALLVAWKRPESCSCARGGSARFCECQDWPDQQARRLLRSEVRP